MLVGHAVDLASAHHFPRRRPSPSRRLHWPSTACASLDRLVPTRADDEPVVDTTGDHADPGHPSHAAACPTAALHDLTPGGHSRRGTPRTPDAHTGHRPPDTWTLRRPHRTLGTGRVDRHAWTLDARTGHWTLAEDADTVTKARSASDLLGDHVSSRALGHPTGFLWTALRRLATMTARRWATCSVAPPAKPRLGALLSSDDYGSSVEREAHGQVLWRVQMWRLA
jgi:hypothetical protein